MTLLIGLVVLACAVWVLFDSHKKGARNPAGWAVFVAVIWFVGLPYYLYKRNKLEPAEQPPSPSNRWWGLAMVITIVLWITVLNDFDDRRKADALPACEAPEVVEVLGKLLNRMAVSIRRSGRKAKSSARCACAMPPWRIASCLIALPGTATTRFNLSSIWSEI